MHAAAPYTLLQLERCDTKPRKNLGERSQFVPLEGPTEESVQTGTHSALIQTGILYFSLSFIQ